MIFFRNQKAFLFTVNNQKPAKAGISYFSRTIKIILEVIFFDWFLTLYPKLIYKRKRCLSCKIVSTTQPVDP